MKSLKGIATIAVILFFVTIFTGCSVYSYDTPRVQTRYENPQWAPPYYQGARYYYLPDIECYYDLSVNEFIFLNNGRWNYSRNIPSLYMDFNLDNCFAVVLDINVYQPWMHHQYYVSHYPRYYYRDYYDHSNFPYVRGFNENRRSAIFWGENERNRARSWDDRNLRENRRFKYTDEDRQYQRRQSDQDSYRQSGNDRNVRNNVGNDVNDRNNDSRNQDNTGNRSDINRKAEDRTDTRTDGRVESRTDIKTNESSTRDAATDNATRRQPTNSTQTERPQNTNYYGRTIGNPVKVGKQMQDKSETRSSRSSTTRTPKESTTKASSESTRRR